MGRRFLLMLGMMLLALASAALPLAQAQEGSGPPSAPDPAPSTPSGPVPQRPIDLPLEQAPSLDDGPSAEKPTPVPKEGPRGRRGEAGPAQDPAVTLANGSGQPVRDQKGSAAAPADSPSAGPPPEPSAADGASPSARDDLAASATPGGDPAGDLRAVPIPADRLPVGKQSVAVTVDVQSPPNMNLHRPANVRLMVRNSGASDALQVRVVDVLPEGLKYLSSRPKVRARSDSALAWSLGTLPAGSETVIDLVVEPVKTGAFDHGASVWFQTGSRAKTRVFRPILKVEQFVSSDKVLKGQPVEFKVRVTNMGDGPARDVKIVAKLSPGLRYGSSDRDSDEMTTEPIPVLAAKQSQELDPLVADALLAGERSCTVSATSPDVVKGENDGSRNTRTVTVVEPALKLTVAGPKKRVTDTVAHYEIAVENPGTAAAKKVRVATTVPPGMRLLAVPKGARYDPSSLRLQWSIDSLEPGPHTRKLGFDVKVGDVGRFEIEALARGDGALEAEGKLETEVIGMADVDLTVSERQRVVDVGGKTVFQIRLRNYGTKDAHNIELNATLSKNLSYDKDKGSIDGLPPGLAFMARGGEVRLASDEGGGIKSLGAGKELILNLEVEVTGAEPKVANCKVTVKHDELPEGIEDSAHVQVLPPQSADPGQ